MSKTKLIKFAVMTVQDAVKYSADTLTTIYEEREALTISDWIIENITGSPKTDRIANKEKELADGQKLQLDKYLQKLLNHEPVQYVLNEAWFFGIKFYVDPGGLIPRPETEELVEWIISDCKFPITELSILDIGSGSGCIPVVLKRKFRKAEVWSCDISKTALLVAKKNAEELKAKINFLHIDFLDMKHRDQFPLFDVIVSNPPYVPEKDKAQMQPNVANYEPSIALFVPDNDPLIFYKAIAEFGKKKLKKEGKIYIEVHENFGEAVSILFQSKGYSTQLKKDMQGKDRMIKAALIFEKSFVL
ncbi:MAG TPA: peptide chain release factor N(5)-glutamine methyltransferase [Chitinophagaceae bacterium]|nr:peptide chain release factor N(5)-glutamine methyltransferase [Chitinophagaceae bacterium]